MDKNTVIGLVLLAVLFFAFFWYTNKQQQAIQIQTQHIADSTHRADSIAKAKNFNPVQAKMDSLKNDSIIAGNFNGAAVGSEVFSIVENDVMKATFSNKGGQLKKVELKKYKSYIDSSLVVLAGSKDDALGYTINTAPNQSAETSTLFFGTPKIAKNADGSQTITYTLAATNGESITHQYVVKKSDYLIDWNIGITGADKLLTQNSMNLHWAVQTHQQQLSRTYETQQAMLVYYTADGYDYNTAISGTTKDFDAPVQWFGFKQQFFNTTIIAKNNFTSGHAEMKAFADTVNQLSGNTANMKLQLPAASQASVALQLYFGPNDYPLLKQYGNGMENVVNLGSGMFAFVKYLNHWIIMPVFNFFAGLINSYGIVILLLTFFIRLVISPLTYSSYLSGAKMRALRPELDTLKKKFGDDQQGFAVEQMKLFREAGVNPLGGCIPALLQIPIFFALYSFFSSNILLRGQSFMWVKDLSSYDTLVHFNSSIWLIGDHISFFTITAVLTSFLISIYNMSMTPTQSNPAMKYMPYIFPFILFFVFNRLPSALTWYYTVSNIVTLAIQFVIQNYIIDHDKILATIEEKRKTPKPKSKFQERYAQMMETQKKMQDIKQKTTKK